MGVERLSFAPAAMDRDTALAYTSFGEEVLRDLEKRGIVRFLPMGPHGRKITQRRDLDRALAVMFANGGDLPVDEDMAFADDG